MRNLIALLFAFLLYSTSAFAWNSGASCPSGQYDMLGWLTPQSGGSTVHNEGQYLNGPWVGQTSYNYFVVNAADSTHGTQFNIKQAAGYPWDINLYDANYIYFYETGLSFTGSTWLHKWPASNYSTAEIFLPRCSPGGNPGWSHTNAASTDYATADDGTCTLYQSTFPENYGQVWGPSNETLGGNLPNNNPTLIYVLTEYYDAADGNGPTWHQEWQYLQEGYGLVWWNFFTWNGSSYVWANGTSLNTQTNGGAPAYSNPCG